MELTCDIKYDVVNGFFTTQLSLIITSTFTDSLIYSRSAMPLALF